MPAPAQQQQQSGDNSMAPVWIMVGLFFALFITWEGAHKYIVSMVFWFNIMQAKMVAFFLGDKVLSPEIYYMQTIDPATVTWNQLVDLTTRVGEYVRYPYAALLAFLAIMLYRSDVTLRFHKVHSMKTLRTQEQYNWPSIMPVVKEDLVSEDINTGHWAMALTPMEFAKKYHLLRKSDGILDDPVPGQEMTAGIRRGDAKRVFTMQLGPYWEGFDRCPPHGKALAAVFMARINRDRAAAMEILNTISKSYATGKVDYSVANGTLRKYQQADNVQSIVSKHAYFLTAMASLLVEARNDGVVPTSEFLWLKPIDRRLWYMLNCVGRQTPYSEVGGPFAHWRAELAMGRRSLVPMIDEAIKALEVAVKEVKLSPEELEALKP